MHSLGVQLMTDSGHFLHIARTLSPVLQALILISQL